MESMTQPTDDVGGNAWWIVLLVLLPLLVLSLMGCSTTEVAEAQAQSHWLRFRITDVPNDGVWVNTTVIVDTETGCQYIFAKQAELGGLELLVDKYGNPLLAEGYSRREVGMSDDGE
jgi:hypothetical protein